MIGGTAHCLEDELYIILFFVSVTIPYQLNVYF